MNKSKYFFIVSLSFLVLLFPVLGDASVTVTIGRSPNEAESPTSTKTGAKEALPSGFGSVKLGMSVDDVKEMLLKESQFGYRGTRDVSLLPGENRVLIETDTSRTAPNSFLERCWFQFYEDKLYTITINMKKDKLDHYSVFSKLCEKYGNPTYLNPEKAEWKDSNFIIDLERPLSLKYTDRVVFEKIQADSMVNATAAEKSRDAFLEGL